MAILIPEVPDSATQSERRFLARLRRELDDDCTVLHSLTVVNHANKLWGEADFVVLTPKGIFVLELKGSRVSCQNGRWRFTKVGNSDFYEKTEGPFRQAESAMVAVRKNIWSDSKFKKLLIGYGVVMPFERFEATGSEINQDVLLDRRKFDRPLKLYFGELAKYWKETYLTKHGKNPELPAHADLSEIRQLLRPDIQSTFNLGSYLNGVEQELIRLTNDQVAVMRGIQGNPRTVVRGKAGTGKTVLAVDRARQLAAEGKNVLYLCFNRLLAEHVFENIKNDSAGSLITVKTVYNYYREAIDASGLGAELNEAETAGATQEELFGEIFPRLFTDALIILDRPPVEALVIDEAQDILTVRNLEAFELLVQGGLKDGSWHLFLDPNQNIYDKSLERAEDFMSGIAFAKFDLNTNCRNTRQVAVTASIVSGIDLPLEGVTDGPEVKPIYCSGRDDMLAKVRGEIGKLLDGGLNPDDMILLSQWRLENSALSKAGEICGLPVIDITGPAKKRAGLHFSTIHAFKGLERKVVLAVDLANVGRPEAVMLHYTGLSRARVYLLPFFDTAEKPAYEAQTSEFGKRLLRRGV